MVQFFGSLCRACTNCQIRHALSALSLLNNYSCTYIQRFANQCFYASDKTQISRASIFFCKFAVQPVLQQAIPESRNKPK